MKIRRFIKKRRQRERKRAHDHVCAMLSRMAEDTKRWPRTPADILQGLAQAGYGIDDLVEAGAETMSGTYAGIERTTEPINLRRGL